LSTRREVIIGAGALAMAGCQTAMAPSTLTDRIAAMETRLGGGRLGLAASNTETGETIEYRSGERFGMASTFKLGLAAMILTRAEQGTLSLRDPISLKGVEILDNSPVTAARAADGEIRIGELCQAIIQVSDNTGANLLLDRIGGPAGLTAFLRANGDPDTRLDRKELDLNYTSPGDPRDTTTPGAMLRTAQHFLVGTGLKPDWRDMLTRWLEGTTTGLGMLRRNLPPGWRAGDKTGRGANGNVNDIAIVWPPSRKPILIAAYSREGKADTAAREAVHAEIGRMIFEVWG
jgi:beta-lactamase class A